MPVIFYARSLHMVYYGNTEFRICTMLSKLRNAQSLRFFKREVITRIRKCKENDIIFTWMYLGQ